MSTAALPELIDETEVARLCGESLEWVRSRSFHLPVVDPFFPVRVRREDLRTWLDTRIPSSTAAGYLGDTFGAAVRSLAPLATALPHTDLPKGVEVVSTPRFSAGASVAVQTSDNAAVTNIDPVTALVKSGIATVVGDVDAAMQLVDQSPNFDEAMSLGARPRVCGAARGARCSPAAAPPGRRPAFSTSPAPRRSRIRMPRRRSRRRDRPFGS